VLYLQCPECNTGMEATVIPRSNLYIWDCPRCGTNYDDRTAQVTSIKERVMPNAVTQSALKT